MDNIDYKIISSGSKGNAVLINDVLIDAGIPFYMLKKYLYDVKYLLITHTHGDHLKQKTMLQIASQFPTITFIGNYEVHQVYNMNIIANEGYKIETEDYTFLPFRCEHDVLCYGYTWKYGRNNIIYATDTSSLDYAPEDKYDYFFLESNHDEKKLKEAMNEYKGGYNPYLSGKRHLSTQQAKAFYYLHRRSKESELIELHKSKRFY